MKTILAIILSASLIGCTQDNLDSVTGRDFKKTIDQTILLGALVMNADTIKRTSYVHPKELMGEWTTKTKTCFDYYTLDFTDSLAHDYTYTTYVTTYYQNCPFRHYIHPNKSKAYYWTAINGKICYEGLICKDYYFADDNLVVNGITYRRP